MHGWSLGTVLGLMLVHSVCLCYSDNVTTITCTDHAPYSITVRGSLQFRTGSSLDEGNPIFSRCSRTLHSPPGTRMHIKFEMVGLSGDPKYNWLMISDVNGGRRYMWQNVTRKDMLVQYVETSDKIMIRSVSESLNGTAFHLVILNVTVYGCSYDNLKVSLINIIQENSSSKSSSKINNQLTTIIVPEFGSNTTSYKIQLLCPTREDNSTMIYEPVCVYDGASNYHWEGLSSLEDLCLVPSRHYDDISSTAVITPQLNITGPDQANTSADAWITDDKDKVWSTELIAAIGSGSAVLLALVISAPLIYIRHCRKNKPQEETTNNNIANDKPSYNTGNLEDSNFDEDYQDPNQAYELKNANHPNCSVYVTPLPNNTHTIYDEAVNRRGQLKTTSSHLEAQNNDYEMVHREIDSSDHYYKVINQDEALDDSCYYNIPDRNAVYSNVGQQYRRYTDD